MRHVDEGTIHAWLDGQVTDPAELAWIEEHVRGCSACRLRLAGERAVLDGADALLAAAAPLTDLRTGVFETMAARARESETTEAASTRGMRRRLRLPVIAAGWAASLALAAALGWAARDAAPVEPVSPGAVTVAEHPAAPVPDRPNGSIAAEAPPVRPQDTQAASRPADGIPRAAAATPVAPPAPPAGAGREQVSGQARAGSIDDQSREQTAGTGAAPDPPQGGGAAPASAESTQTVQISGPPQTTAVQRYSDSPLFGSSLLPAGPAARWPEPRGVLTPATTAGIAQGRLMIDGQLSQTYALSTAGAAGGGTWVPVPRTQAAAASGMPLYGIDGLTPLVTRLSPDRARVQTMYRTESGESVSLTQQRIAVAQPAPAVAGSAAGIRDAAAESPTVDVSSASRTATWPSNGGGQEWSTVRGDVRVTLRGADNLEVLGERLRLD